MAAFSAHRADAATTHTVLSVLDGAHRAGGGVLGFFDTHAARALRLVDVEASEAVAGAPWADAETRIKRHVGKWRASFPRARAANVSVEAGASTNDFTDADFAHLAGVHTLDMSRCNQATITDGAFAHLAGVHTLNMSGCRQWTITDGAFAHLAGVHTLDMSWCRQATITDGAFAHLAGVHTLDMSDCTQATITDGAFAHLAGVVSLRAVGTLGRSI